MEKSPALQEGLMLKPHSTYRPGLRKQLAASTCGPTDTHLPSLTTTRGRFPDWWRPSQASPPHWPPQDPAPPHLQQTPFLLTIPLGSIQSFLGSLLHLQNLTCLCLQKPGLCYYLQHDYNYCFYRYLTSTQSQIWNIPLSNVWTIPLIPPILVLFWFLTNNIMTETQLLYWNSYYRIHFTIWVEGKCKPVN